MSRERVSISRDFTFWIKNEKFNVEDFLDHKAYGKDFEGGTMVIVRLAPQDYHR